MHPVQVLDIVAIVAIVAIAVIAWPSEACSGDQDRYGESLQYGRRCKGERELAVQKMWELFRRPNLRFAVTRSRLMMSSPC